MGSRHEARRHHTLTLSHILGVAEDKNFLNLWRQLNLTRFGAGLLVWEFGCVGHSFSLGLESCFKVTRCKSRIITDIFNDFDIVFHHLAPEDVAFRRPLVGDVSRLLQAC